MLRLVSGMMPQVDPGPRVGHSVGWNPYQRVGAPRHRAGAPLIGASQGMPYPSFATAQGGNPALVPNPAMSGTRTGLPFPTATLQPSGTGSSASVVQGIFRPSRLIVAVSTDTTALGTSVAITALLVGSINIFVNANPMTCALFQATGVECGITFPTAHSGWTIQINFSNLSATTTSVVLPAMLGEYIQGGNHVIAG
jgi:hypothetical protein